MGDYNFINDFCFLDKSSNIANATKNKNQKKTTDPIIKFGSSRNNNISDLNDIDACINDTSNDYAALGWNPSKATINPGVKAYMNLGWGPSTNIKLTDINSVSSASASSATTPGKGMSSAKSGTYGGRSLDQEQVNNAKIIADVGKSMGMSQKDIQTAIATAMQESSLRNITYGDDVGPDSCGLFQQRDSWGSRNERMDPATAAKLFYNELKKVPNRESKSLTQCAYEVQKCAAKYKDRYANWEGMAQALTA